MTAPLLAATGLEKRYGARKALDGVSLAVQPGEIVGFLGPNGAGKSTTLKILAGVLAADAGEVRVGGVELAADPIAAKRRLGYLPEAVPLPPELRVVEYLAFRAELKGVPRGERVRAVEEAMEKGRVTAVARAPIGTLSKGYRQRVGLADALVAKPPCLLLDEPTAGLDPAQIVEVREVLRGLGGAVGVLLSTHILSEVEAIASRVIVLHHGRVLADSPVTELRGRAGAGAELVRLRVDDPARAAALPGFTRAADGVTLSVAEGTAAARDTAVADAVRALVAADVAVLAVERERPRLEAVFLALTEGA